MCKGIKRIRGFLHYHFMDSKGGKNPQLFKCINCDYNKSKRKDYNKHIQPKKRLSDTNGSKFVPKSPKK